MSSLVKTISVRGHDMISNEDTGLRRGLLAFCMPLVPQERVPNVATVYTQEFCGDRSCPWGRKDITWFAIPRFPGPCTKTMLQRDVGETRG